MVGSAYRCSFPRHQTSSRGRHTAARLLRYAQERERRGDGDRIRPRVPADRRYRETPPGFRQEVSLEPAHSRAPPTLSIELTASSIDALTHPSGCPDQPLSKFHFLLATA